MRSTKLLVVMPVFNAEPFVKKAVDSILSQTFSDFQFLIINDGSTDRSIEVIRSVHDDRVIIMDQLNLGPGSVMNRAIDYALGNKIEFIARMDADDISLPNRLENQLNLLNKHSKAGACSSNCYYIDEETEKIIGASTVSTSSKLIRWEILHGLRGLIQGACIFRTSALAEIGGYRLCMKRSEEVDVFLRLVECNELINSQDFLYKIRLNRQSLSLNDVHKNVLYQFFALDCAARKKDNLPQQNFENFKMNLTLETKFKIWREEELLKTWRKSLEYQNPFTRILAALIDPRRVLVRALRLLK